MLEFEKNSEFKSVTLGNNIKQIRKNCNYTQEEFSEKLGITPQFLSAVERGVAGISLNTAISICEIANCSIMLLFKNITKTSSIEDNFELLSERDKIIINTMIHCLLENQ